MIGTVVGAAAAGLSAMIAAAAPPESRFEVSPDGRTVDIRVDGLSRRAVIERLLDGRSVALEWHDPAFAAEPVSGAFRGSLAQVTRRLLGEANYVMSYTAGDSPRLSRLVVMGKTRTGAGGNTAPVAVPPAAVARDEGPASRGTGTSSPRPASWPAPDRTDPTLDRPGRVVVLPPASPEPPQVSGDLPIRLAAGPPSAGLPEIVVDGPQHGTGPSPAAAAPEPRPIEISITTMMPSTPVESIEPPMPGPIAEGIVLPAPPADTEPPLIQ